MSEEKEQTLNVILDRNSSIAVSSDTLSNGVIRSYSFSLPLASKAKDITLNALCQMVPQQKLEEACRRITDLIMKSAEQGCSSCIVSNDTLEDLFSANDEEFDIELVECVLAHLKLCGYKVKYDELIYGDISNLMEIKW